MELVMDSSTETSPLNVQKDMPESQNQAMKTDQLLALVDNVSTSTEKMAALGQGLIAIAPNVPEAEAVALSKKLGLAVWNTQNSAQVQILVQSISAISSRLKADEATAQLLFDILKNPLAQRDVVTSSFRKKFSLPITGEPGFWEIVEWGKIQYPHLDFENLPYEQIETKTLATSITGWLPGLSFHDKR
jgi:hypothetical protein